jgi:LysR family glycine cleavage system transcriptional activator
LFERHHNAVVLNPQGKRFLTEVSPHYDALASAVERATSPEREVRLRIAVPSLFASQRLVPALPSLLLQHPNIRVEIDTKSDRLTRLNEGIDAAIVISDGVDPSFYSKTVSEGRVVALGSLAFLKDNPELKNISEIAKLPALLHRDMPKAFEVWREGNGLPALEPAERIFFDSGQLVLDAAAQALGVAYMLDTHLASSTDGRLTQLSERSVESPYSYRFACSANALARPAVRAFHDWIFDTFVVTGTLRSEARTS